jgi:hypothetical protein
MWISPAVRLLQLRKLKTDVPRGGHQILKNLTLFTEVAEFAPSTSLPSPLEVEKQSLFTASSVVGDAEPRRLN